MHRAAFFVPPGPVLAMAALGGRTVETPEAARRQAIQRLRAFGEPLGGYPVALLAALLDAGRPLAERELVMRVAGIDFRSAAQALARLRGIGLVESVVVDDEVLLVAAGATPVDVEPLPAVIRRRRATILL